MADSRPSFPTGAGGWHFASCPSCRAVFRGGFQRCPNDGELLVQGDADPLVGTVLAGRYQIEAILGDGGIGRVYRARHVRMSRRFAVKVPFGELAYDRKVRARFANEAEAASRLSHPNVIGVVDVGETSEGLFYLAMDLAEGTPLSELIARGPVPEDRALRIVAQIADGLAHAHDRGLIHRDLKPENVILIEGADGSEQARIVDFGLAVVEEERRSNRLTTEGVVLGTPHYMAPEQSTDEGFDHRADLFALGLILFELLAGCLPFDGTALEVARQNLSRALPTVAERTGLQIDPLIEALIGWLTRKYARERPARTQEVAEVARLLLRGERDAAAVCIPGAARPVSERVEPAPPPPPPVIEPEPTAPAGRRRERVVRVVLLALAALGVVSAVAVLVLLARGDLGTPAVVAIDAAVTPIAVIELDAGAIEPVPAEVVPIDAGVEAIDAAPAPPARTVRVPPRRTAPAPDAAVVVKPPVTPPPPRIEPPPAGEPPTSASLRALYEQVGRKLDAAMAKHGFDATAALRKRYAAIPYLEAIRKPPLRDEAQQQLRALAREVDALK